MTIGHAKVARVDAPERGLWSLSLRGGSTKEALIVAALPGLLDVGIVTQRPVGKSAGPSISQLRHHLEGARVDEVARSRRVVRIAFSRGDQTHFLSVAPSKPYGAWWLSDPEGSTLLRSPGASSAAPSEEAHLVALSPGELRAQGARVLTEHESVRRAQLERALARHVRRLSKKREAIEADLERASRAEALRETASLILAHASEIPPNANSFETRSWSREGQPLRIELDPRKSPQEQAKALFERAKRLKRGQRVAPERLAAVDAELAGLARVKHELAGAKPAEVEAKLETLGVATHEARETVRLRRKAGGRAPYREFVSEDGSSVFVGRSAADNDRLTLRVARPHDLWLHVRGVTGAHVVVRLDKGKSCSSETLIDAATLAAHFSDLRDEPVVDVLYTPRRFVHKRKGSAVGSVTLGREKVIALRFEPARLRRLLDGEKRSR